MAQRKGFLSSIKKKYAKKSRAAHRHALKGTHELMVIGFVFVAAIIISSFFVATTLQQHTRSRNESKFGVTFSIKQAQALGLDWREVYLASLNELGVKYFRIPVYWDRVEFNRDIYEFEEIDFIVDEAARNDAKLILAIGQRVPRWPECHTPAWAAELNEGVRHEQILELLTEIVNRYKDREQVIMWQVENEPLLDFFGECPKGDVKFLAREVEHVKNLDRSREVMVTDAGELSFWLRTSSVADVLGVSLYRITWNPIFGNFFYPLTPQHYQQKAAFSEYFVNKVIISELQAEPWGNRPLNQMSLEEQYKTMNMSFFRENIQFAKKIGFEQIYLWGVEWWYWLKLQGVDEFWEEARTLFHD